MCAIILAVLVAVPAWAQGPEDTVRWMYTSLVNPGPIRTKGLEYLTQPAQRDQFLSRRLMAFYAANDTHGNDLATACVDFGFQIPGQDFDEAEIARTITVEATGDATRQSVTARFTTFGAPALVVYDFIVEDGFWRLDDIAGPGWRVSNITCEPKVQLTGYCYQTTGDTLRLDLGPDGRGQFEMHSWQSNGHTCGAWGPVQPIDGGWLFQGAADAPGCRIEILVTQDRGLRLTDTDWGCKRTHCGQRAVIDGMTFPVTSQIDCAQMREN